MSREKVCFVGIHDNFWYDLIVIFITNSYEAACIWTLI